MPLLSKSLACFTEVVRCTPCDAGSGWRSLFSPVSPPTALSGGTDQLNLPTMNVGQVSSLHSVQSHSSLLPSLTQSLTNLSAMAAESLWGHQQRL